MAFVFRARRARTPASQASRNLARGVLCLSLIIMFKETVFFLFVLVRHVVRPEI
jgi:hypothetical protein